MFFWLVSGGLVMAMVFVGSSAQFLSVCSSFSGGGFDLLGPGSFGSFMERL